jgi:hypothetical protein
MAKLNIEGDDLVLSLSSLEKLAVAKRDDREALFPDDNKFIMNLHQKGMLRPWVRSASVIPDAYQALKQDIPAWRMYPPPVPHHHLPVASVKAVIQFFWGTGTLAVVYGIHRPAVLVESTENYRGMMLHRLVITVRDPELVVASIRSKLG